LLSAKFFSYIFFIQQINYLQFYFPQNFLLA
jgi:hypothetical protein